MTSNRDHFDSFAPHTRLKHAVYGYYVQRWARILLRNWDVVRIVDACAGEGADEAGKPGSPLIGLREADAAARQLSQSTGTRKSAELVAIEKDPAKFRKLSQVLSGRTGTRLENSTLGDVISSLEPDFARMPHLFFIDPFGLSPLQAHVIQRVLTGPRNEVFLLFAGQAIRRHFGSYVAARSGENEVQENLFGELLPESVPAAEPNVHLERGGKISETTLDAAFGPLDWRTASKLPKERRLEAALTLYADLLCSFGARRVLPMPVFGPRGEFKYHLIYATKSERGYEVMKDAMRYGLKQGIVGSEAGMEFGMSVPVSQIAAAVVGRFAGQTVPWTGDKGETVRAYALEHTPAMHNQMEQLRIALERYVVGGRRNAPMYTFPPA